MAKTKKVINKIAHSKKDEQTLADHLSGRNSVSFKNDKPTEDDSQFSADNVATFDRGSNRFGTDEKDYTDSINELTKATIRRAEDRKTGVRYTKQTTYQKYNLSEETSLNPHILSVIEDRLNEISKETLGRYIRKANRSHAFHSSERDLKNDNVNQLQRMRHDTNDDNARDSIWNAADIMRKQARKHDRKVDNREMGIARAVNRLTKEETEPLDELSRKTLASYIKVASHGDNRTKKSLEGASAALETFRPHERMMNPVVDRIYRIKKNRKTGIERASDKLAKEETSLVSESIKKLNELFPLPEIKEEKED